MTGYNAEESTCLVLFLPICKTFEVERECNFWYYVIGDIMGNRILLVEDDEMLRNSMSEVLIKQHFVVEQAKDFFEAEEKISLYSWHRE